MLVRGIRQASLVMAVVCAATCGALGQTAADVEAAISVVKALDRPGKDNLATVWDGNKYVQCRRMSDRSLRCEAGGSLMQVSLEGVLTPDHIGRLAAMGWMLDPSFGNYVQTFQPDVSAKDVAEKIRSALTQGYDADPQKLEVETTSIRSEPCPPRHGPSQNRAGMIGDSPKMAAHLVYGCSYKAKNDEPEHKLGPGSSAADLIALYGTTVTVEIQRLRINIHRAVYVIFDVGLGYIQCASGTDPNGFYCEAESADSWPALAAVLTPERIDRLHAAGFADPGRAPNYSKTYLADKIDDASLAAEVLTLLHDVYGYYGASKLKVVTEEK